MSIINTWSTSTIERQNATFKLKQLYELQAIFLFDQYEPVLANPAEAAMSFINRLDRWLSCFSDPIDQWAVFRTFQYFFFVGKDETDELYRCAVNHKLLPWLVEQEKLDIFSPDLSSQLNDVVSQTWPCPVTDSLRINSLLHRTNLKGQSLRPDWLSLKELGDKDRIAKYISNRKNSRGEITPIKYLVLFEDFVGSGSQCGRAAKFALEGFDGPILLAPLVVCHPGDKYLRDLASKSNGRLTYDPVVVLSAECLVSEQPTIGEPSSFPSLRLAMKNGHTKGNFSDPAFGYEGVGSLASSYSNCPNNSPPIFHGVTSTWPYPLFPRKGRA